MHFIEQKENFILNKQKHEKNHNVSTAQTQNVFFLENVEFYSEEKKLKYFTYLKSFKSAFEYAQLK